MVFPHAPRRLLIRQFLALLVVLGACAPAALDARQTPSAPESPNGLPLRVLEAKYGALAARTAPLATCSAELTFKMPELGEEPPRAIEGRADGDGLLTLSYAAPRLPAGTVPYALVCAEAGRSGRADGSFAVGERAIRPVRLNVAVRAGIPRDRPVAGETASLVPLRDRAVAELRRTLAPEWSLATRGLGSLALVERGADMVISVIAAAGVSKHRTARGDGSQDVVIFVSDERGPIPVENLVAVALHELGHIWCCFGPGAQDGHWSVPEEEPGLFGVDRFGLMNHPVTCKVYASGVVSCPNRFSARELRTMGFGDVPPPPPSPCSRVPALRAEHDQLRAEIRTLRAEIDAAEATARELLAEIRRIEEGGVTRDERPRYNSLVDRYNALVAENKARVDRHNALVDRANAIGAEIDRLVGC